MLTRQVNKLLKEGEKGVEKLYKLHLKYFDLVDTWAERMTNGGLLDEYELSQAIDRMTGVLAKLGSVANALETLMIEMQYDEEVKLYKSYDKLRAQDCNVVKAKARDKISKIRKWHGDFENYTVSAEKMVTSAQSRIKRLTVEKGAKRVDYCGEQPLEDKPSTGTPIPENPTTTCENGTSDVSPESNFSEPDHNMGEDNNEW